MKFFNMIAESFQASRKEMKKTSTITITALLIGLSTVLYFFTLVPNPYMKIGFSSIPIAIAGLLFGPFVSGMAGGIVDILCCILRPTDAYFPGFTFDKILMGVFFGLFLYQRKPNLKNIIGARLCVTFIVNLLFNTLWLCTAFGQVFEVIFPVRLMKNLVVFPVEVALLYVVTLFVWNACKDKIGAVDIRQGHHEKSRYGALK